MNTSRWLPVLLIALLACSGKVLATASYSATSAGTLTLTAITGPLTVTFFGASPEAPHSNTASPGIQIYGNGGSTAGTTITKTPAAGTPLGDSTFQTAVVSGSQTAPGLLTTDVLTTVLLDVMNTSPTDPGTFTVRWDWSLAALTGIDDPLHENAVATAGAFLEDVTAGSPLIYESLTVFDGDSDSRSGSSTFTLTVLPGDRNIIITGVDANGSAHVVSAPAAVMLLLAGLPLLRRRN